MRKFGLMCAFLVAGSAAGCYNVNYAGLMFQCDPAQPEGAVCPDGYQCDGSKKLCVPMSDGTSLPDMAGGPVSTNACPSGMGYDVGIQGGKKVYACQTKFSNTSGNTADAQCKNGYVLCQNASNINLMACTVAGASTGGFFISAVEVRRDNAGEVLCNTPTTGHPYPMWTGCGRKLSTTIAQGSNCQGFTMALDCPMTGTFNCGGRMQSARIDDVTNNDPAGGVLCCGP